MTTCAFASFADASAFAKRMVLEHKAAVRLVRRANKFIVEGTFPTDTPDHIEPERLSIDAKTLPAGLAALPSSESPEPATDTRLCIECGVLIPQARVAESVLPTATTSIEDAAESIMSELKAIKLELDADEKRQNVKLERIKAERKLRARVQPNLYAKIQQNYSGEPQKIFRAIEWEAEAPVRAAQAEEHKQRVSELSHKGGANNNTLCPICGYSLVPTSSSSHYCKCQRHTNYGINEGIAGTREENKKMRGQLWGDMRSRGRGK